MSNDGAQTAAGITLQHISEAPPFPFHDGSVPYTHLETLTGMYEKAQRHFEHVKFEPEFRGSWDARVSKLVLYKDQGDSPAYSFLINGMLLDSLRAERDKKGADLSQNELLQLALKSDQDAVDPNFAAGALNAINSSYYRSPLAFERSAQLATLFTENRPLNMAFGALFAELTRPDRRLRLKELCSGSNTGHWKDIALAARRNGVTDLSVILSDFVPLQVDQKIMANGIDVATEQYSLFDDMVPLSADQRVDGILVTYGFDSVWQPEDMRLTRVGDKWYQTLYRVKVADWAPRRNELLDALRYRKVLSDAQAYEYDGIVVETAMEPIDVEAHPFGSYIHGHDRPTINFPGGLIKRVVNAFDTQLTPNGIFVSADAGDFGFSAEPFPTETDSGVSGVIGRYHMDDYRLAEKILEQAFGLEVQLLSLNGFADKYLPHDWRALSSKRDQRLEDKPWNGIMIAKRRLVQ